MVDEHVLDMLPAYAVGCLEEDEQSRVTDHLATCADCQGELFAYQEIAGNLPLALSQVEPPPEVKTRLMEKIRAEKEPPPISRRISPWEAVRTWLRGIGPTWGIASLAVIILLLSGNLLLWRQVDNLKKSNPTQFQIVALRGTDASPDATGTVVISGNGEYGTLVVDGLGQLDPTQQYQLWLIHDGKRTSGGVFSVSPHGYASLEISSSQPLTNYTGFGITIEPAGGSPGPTGKKVLGGEL